MAILSVVIYLPCLQSFKMSPSICIQMTRGADADISFIYSLVQFISVSQDQLLWLTMNNGRWRYCTLSALTPSLSLAHTHTRTLRRTNESSTSFPILSLLIAHE